MGGAPRGGGWCEELGGRSHGGGEKMRTRLRIQDISKREGEILSPVQIQELTPLPPPYDKLEEQPGWKEIKPEAREQMVCKLDGVVALSLPQPESEAEKQEYVDKFEAGLRDLIKKITDAGATVVLATPSMIGEAPDGSNKLDPMLEQYAAISRKVAKDTGTQLCDLRKAFVDYLKKHNKDNKGRGVLTSDGVHLNPEGNKFVANEAATAITEALKKRK